DEAPLNNDGLTPCHPSLLHSSTINSHQGHLTTTQTNEVLENIGETSGGAGLLLHELEIDKLKNDLKVLREHVLKGDEQAAREQLLVQFEALNTELEHHRCEQIEMKSKFQDCVMQHEIESDDVSATDAFEQAY
ncbi:unnamed protein product, partial [Rotaria sp. Silwood2]